MSAVIIEERRKWNAPCRFYDITIGTASSMSCALIQSQISNVFLQSKCGESLLQYSTVNEYSGVSLIGVDFNGGARRTVKNYRYSLPMNSLSIHRFDTGYPATNRSSI